MACLCCVRGRLCGGRGRHHQHLHAGREQGKGRDNQEHHGSRLHNHPAFPNNPPRCMGNGTRAAFCVGLKVADLLLPCLLRMTMIPPTAPKSRNKKHFFPDPSVIAFLCVVHSGFFAFFFCRNVATSVFLFCNSMYFPCYDCSVPGGGRSSRGLGEWKGYGLPKTFQQKI